MKKFIPFFIPGILFATNYYVANWGNDQNNGRSWDSAFATTQRAANTVAIGDSVFVANGDYVGFDLRRGGSQTLPIVFKAFGDSVRITRRNGVTPDGVNVENANWVVIDGFKLIGIERAGIRVAVAQHVTVRNNVCDRNGRWGIFTGFADYAIIERNECKNSQQEHGIYFSNSADHPIIRYNKSHHNNSCGIHMNGDSTMGGDGLITDATVEGNIVYENGVAGGSGVNCDGVAESKFFNNLLYMNHASGISLYKIDASAGSYNNKIYNNTIVNASNGRWCLNINTQSRGDTVYNNILINLHPSRGSIVIDSSSIPGYHSDYNIVINRLSNNGGNTVITLAAWQQLGYDRHSMLAEPLDSIFRNWSIGDYHLRQNSQAIDSGTSRVLPIVRYDLDSIMRPQGNGFDIGAYEHIPTSVYDEYTNRIKKPIPLILCTANFVDFINIENGSRVRIYNLAGSRVKDFKINSTDDSRWDTKDVASGIYLYTVELREKENLAGKIIIIK